MTIGFIGLGLMGQGMALNLCRAGYDLVVHDLSRASATPPRGGRGDLGGFGRRAGGLG